MAELTDIREIVRERYASAAKAAAAGAYDQAQALESESGCCGSDGAGCSPADATGVFGAAVYDDASRESVPDAAVSASLGCGVPTAVADLRDGETVLDLGSGAGADVLISARRVGPDGQGDRARHDRRDARARPRSTPPRPASRTSSSSRAISRTCRCRTPASTS